MVEQSMKLLPSTLYAESWNIAWRQAAPGAILTENTTENTVRAVQEMLSGL